MERWRPVLGHEGYYEVSDLGRVRSLDRQVARTRTFREVKHTAVWHLPGKMLRANPNTAGYPTVRLQGGRVVCVHTLVLEAFVGPRPPDKECCHGDGNRGNPALGNLRWGTRKENMADMRAHGNYRGGARPWDTPGAKLTTGQVCEIRLRLSQGARLQALAEEFSVTTHTVRRVGNRSIWKHV